MNRRNFLIAAGTSISSPAFLVAFRAKRTMEDVRKEMEKLFDLDGGRLKVFLAYDNNSASHLDFFLADVFVGIERRISWHRFCIRISNHDLSWRIVP